MPENLATPIVTPRPGYLDRENPLDGFDWQEIRQRLETINHELASRATFLVVFSSVQRPDLNKEDIDLLHRLDDASHDEARASEALIHYFAGPVDYLGRAVSWCLWSDRQAAAEALHGETHKQAIALARAGKFYDDYAVRFFAVQPDDTQGYALAPVETGHHFTNNKKEGSHANV